MTELAAKQIADTKWGKYPVYPDDLIGTTILGGEWWDRFLIKPFLDTYALPYPDKLVIDIGAFVGQNVVYLAKHGIKSIAVEPVFTTELLEALGINNIQDEICKVISRPAYSRSTYLKRAIPELHRPNLGGTALVLSGLYEHEYITTILDGVLPDNAKVSAIKSDAQGCDLPALIGLAKTIRRDHPAILFEFEEDLVGAHGHNWDNYERFFDDLGYQLKEQDGLGYKNNYVALWTGEIENDLYTA